MGPGRLTGMNVRYQVSRPDTYRVASMGPGRLTGMNGGDVLQTDGRALTASMGPGRLTGMNVGFRLVFRHVLPLQWGPVD